MPLAAPRESGAVEEEREPDRAVRPAIRRALRVEVRAAHRLVEHQRARCESSRSIWPVAVVSPGRSAFDLAERAPESMPSASAMRSMCTSTANSVCGAPNPRKAPFGGVFVNIGSAAYSSVVTPIRARRRECSRATARRGSA